MLVEMKMFVKAVYAKAFAPIIFTEVVICTTERLLDPIKS